MIMEFLKHYWNRDCHAMLPTLSDTRRAPTGAASVKPSRKHPGFDRVIPACRCDHRRRNSSDSARRFHFDEAGTDLLTFTTRIYMLTLCGYALQEVQHAPSMRVRKR